MKDVSSNLTKKDSAVTRSIFLLTCFFLSGVAGLIYQILWVRMIDKVIGSAPFAVATILTVFMAGLAFGSYIAGKRIDRIEGKNGLLSLYGKLEVSIGIYSLLIPFFIFLVKPVYGFVYSHLFETFWLYTFFTFVGCTLLLIIPTALMGATLPVLCRYYVVTLDHLGTRTGRLYGLNTAGAAIGAFLCGLLMIREWGVWNSLFAAAGINFLVGAVCIVIGNVGISPQKDRHRERRPPKTPAKGVLPKGDRDPVRAWAVAIFCVSGFCAMGYEVIWTRLLGLIIGPTTYSFTLVVGSFIISIAVGSLFFGWLADRVTRISNILIFTQLGAALLALFVTHFLGSSQFFFAKLIFTFQHSFNSMLMAQSFMVFLILIGPTFLLGATFPLVNKIYAHSIPHIGHAVGTAYALNTIGAISGSFVVGFILIPWFGKENAFKLVCVLQFAFALAAWGRLRTPVNKRSGFWIPFTASAVLGISLFIHFPSWNRQLLSYGRYRGFENMKADLVQTSWLQSITRGSEILLRYEIGREIIFYGDGIAGFTTVERLIDSLGTVKYTLLNSGKPDASSHGDRSTQTLLAHVPLLFHPDPEQVMVLGLASGMTAGETLLYPIKRLDVLEINPKVMEACEFFTAWNNDCLTDPRSHIILQDGRNHLALTRNTYDVIISEPSNPWMAGLANLYTLECFQTVRERLRKNGIFVQWIHSYEMDWQTFSMIGRTFAKVFPKGLLMRTLTGVGDYLLIGFKEGSGFNLETARRNLSFTAKSKNMHLPEARILYQLIVSEDLDRLFGPGPLHTDDHPRLEFAAPRLLHHSDRTIEEKMARRRYLTGKTKDIMNGMLDTDDRIAMVEFAASMLSPLFGIINPEDCTHEQQKRYFHAVDQYCEETLVKDYAIFPNPASRQSCAHHQVERIRRHLSSDPKNVPTLYSLGIALKEAGKTQAAMEAFKKTVTLDPKHFYALNNLGVTAMERGDLFMAEKAFANSLTINPMHANAYFNLAIIAMTEKKKGKAIDFFQEGLKYQDNPVAERMLKQLLTPD
jgi:spermidine synthase